MSQTLSPASGNVTARPMFSTRVPQDGQPKVVPILVPFSSGGLSYSIDFRTLVESGQIEDIQGVFVNNWSGSQAVSLLVDGVFQTLVCPATAQGTFPVFSYKIARITASITATMTSDVMLHFVNVPLPFNVWSSRS